MVEVNNVTAVTVLHFITTAWVLTL